MTVPLLLFLSATCDPLPSLPSLLYPPSLASVPPGVHVWVAVASKDERVPVLLSDGEAVDATSRRYPERTRAVIELSPQGRLRPGARIALKLGEEVFATGEVGEPKVMVPWSGRGLVRWAKRAWADECVNAGPFLVMEASATYLYLVSEGPRCQGPEFPAVLTRDGPPEEYITDRINWPALVIGDERRGVEPMLLFDPNARGTATVCLRAVDEEGNRSPPVRLAFDRSNPQHFGCLLLFNVKVTPRPLPPYDPGKVLEHAPSREAPSRSRP